MSSFSRRTFFASLTALAACGFEPVYKDGGSADGLRDNIRMFDPTTRDEFELVSRLEERLGRNRSAQYVLLVSLNTASEGLAISGSNDITRFNLTGTANFQLRDVETEEVVFSDAVNTFTSYSASQQSVATRVAQRDAERRLMVLLADKITSQLLLNADLL